VQRPRDDTYEQRKSENSVGDKGQPARTLGSNVVSASLSAFLFPFASRFVCKREKIVEL